MTNNVPQETINSVLVDILKGAKDASSEIYGASKTGIVKAVDFAQEQAPLVVQEFLMWKFAQSVILVIFGVIALGVLGYLFKKCVDWFRESQGLSMIPGFVCVLIIVLVCCMNVVPNIEQMVKVKVAPRVFMIEWVSSQVTGKNLN